MLTHRFVARRHGAAQTQDRAFPIWGGDIGLVNAARISGGNGGAAPECQSTMVRADDGDFLLTAPAGENRACGGEPDIVAPMAARSIDVAIVTVTVSKRSSAQELFKRYAVIERIFGIEQQFE